ncbi:uncharacterized protein LOC110236750 [Exaiptasia diaphana]|uniref:Uncharacterized protein n=1 Tax=Exaiptasia diaphana TaxID=2652724 RepID=A0A913X3E2_EXADI|nr:uncharacterized protein LOC110236750 [Exaiptasia diaphana]
MRNKNIKIYSAKYMETYGEIFRSVIRSERGRNWRKVVKKYEELISQLVKEKGIDNKPFRMLLYECHMLCGEALQHLSQSLKASIHYEKAMKAISTKKVNCCIGCVSGKTLHMRVPALAKIALCHIQLGKYRLAFKCVQEALELDSKNADLHCIKSCINFLMRNIRTAAKCANDAIWLNPRHACAWLLRGKFKEIEKQRPDFRQNKDLEVARGLDSSTISCFTSDIDASRLIYILNRYLPSLRISHTVRPEDIFYHPAQPGLPMLRLQQTRTKKCLRQKTSPPFLCGMSLSFHKQRESLLNDERQLSGYKSGLFKDLHSRRIVSHMSSSHTVINRQHNKSNKSHHGDRVQTLKS